MSHPSFRFPIDNEVAVIGSGRWLSTPACKQVYNAADEAPRTNLICCEFACKLARYRRVALGRDVYDLAQFAERPIDERLVRRLWVLKVWGDVIDDGRGRKPLDPADVLAPKAEGDFAPESIGKLTRPVDLTAWEQRVRARFGFLHDLDDDEKRWAACDSRHRREVTMAIQSGGFV